MGKRRMPPHGLRGGMRGTVRTGLLATALWANRHRRAGIPARRSVSIGAGVTGAKWLLHGFHKVAGGCSFVNNIMQYQQYLFCWQDFHIT